MDFTTSYAHGDVLFFLDGFSVRKGTVTKIVVDSVLADDLSVTTTVTYTMSTALGLQVRVESLVSPDITTFVDSM